MSPDILLAQAAMAAILGMSPCPVPTTTLSAGISAGATSLPVADGRLFPRGAICVINDGITESRLIVDSGQQGQIVLRPRAMRTDGTIASHSQGAVVYCNLYSGRLADPTANIALGSPLLELGVTAQTDSRLWMPNGWSDVLTLHIAYTLKLLPPTPMTPGGTPTAPSVDDNVWALDQQGGARNALDDIAALFKSVGELTPQTGGGRFTFGASARAGEAGGNEAVRDWTQLVGDASTLDFTASLQTRWYATESF